MEQLRAPDPLGVMDTLYHEFHKLASICYLRSEDMLAAHAARQRPPADLFHFTTTDGLIGILSKGEIRASCTAGSNDPSETRHAIQVARELLKGSTSSFRRQLDRMLSSRPRINQFGGHNVYVVSFCRRIDLAPHWMNYGKGGRGIAISFDPAKITHPHPRFSLVPVMYKRNDQEALLSDLINMVEATLTSVEPSSAPEVQPLQEEMAASICTTIIQSVAHQIKQEAFVEEDEWRLVGLDRIDGTRPSTFGLKIEYRDTDARVVPYVSVPLPTPLPVRALVLGYSNPMEPDDESLWTLWRERIGGALQCSRSGVSVR